MTCSAGRAADQVEKRVLLAVDPDLGQIQHVAGRRALPPQLVARCGPQHRDPLAQRRLEGLLVRVPDEQDLAAVRVLEHDRQHVRAGRRHARELAEIQAKAGAFLKFVHSSDRALWSDGTPANNHRSDSASTSSDIRRHRDNLTGSGHDEPMTVDWTQVLLEQFDLEWNLAHGPSLETLTDEEYLWEPVPGCWSIRPTGPGGRGEFEQAWPDPEPAPVTTIAWRLSHLAVGVFGLRASHHFGDGSLTHENAERPLTAKEGVAYFKEQALQWRSHIERLDEEGLARPVGEPEAYLNAPMASLVLHVNREALHHLAEVSLLRDLYRASGGARLA